MSLGRGKYLKPALALAGNLFYVFVYTIWLKRSSVQNIVIGGAAGAVPPLVGWAAVTGRVDLPPLLFFAIIFFWTPAHFWALSLVRQEDYRAAGVPMLRVVRGEAYTRRSILAYAALLLAVSLTPFLANSLSWLYLAVAVGLGLLFVLRTGTRNRSCRHRLRPGLTCKALFRVSDRAVDELMLELLLPFGVEAVIPWHGGAKIARRPTFDPIF